MGKSFNQLPTSTIILDFNNQVWKSYHATKAENTINSDGINVGCIIGLVKTIRYAFAMAKDSMTIPQLVICEDRYPKRKHDLYFKFQFAFKDYDKPVIYKDKRKREDLGYDIMNICQQFMECIPHQKIFMDGEEADDVIASYIMKHSSNIILFSSDKDMWQLLNIHPNLKIYTGATIIVDKTMCLKHFDTEDFNMIPLHKMIRGDAGDNVKSVKNFPFKKSKIAYDECDGTFDDYLDKLIKHFGEEGEYTKKILDNLHLVRLNYFVTKLKYDLKYNAVSFRKADQDKWNKLCYSFEIPSLLNSPLLRIF